jgi:hypothetical protein
MREKWECTLRWVKSGGMIVLIEISLKREAYIRSVIAIAKILVDLNPIATQGVQQLNETPTMLALV